MVGERLRSGLLPITLALAFIVAMTLMWAAGAQSKAGKPIPEDRIADVQLLGVNDFHGNLESPRTLPYNGAQVPVGGAAYLDSYLVEYEAQNPDRTIRVHAGDMVGASPLISSYLLQSKGVQTIVVLAHAGGVQTSATQAVGEILDETAQMSPAVDVVVAGHSHTRLNICVDDLTGATRSAEPGGCAVDKLVVEAFSFGTAFDAVDMKIDRRTKDVISSSASIVTTYQRDETGKPLVQPDPQTGALVQDYKARIAPVANRVVGTAAQDITRQTTPAGESAMGDLIADAQRVYPGQETPLPPADFAFMNPGGIRDDLYRNEIYANEGYGEVTYGELFGVQPFDNQVVRMKLTGDQIYRVLEQQFRPDGSSRILQVSGLKFTSVTFPNGEPISRSATYTVVANSFIATGGDGFTVFKEGANPQTLGGDLDALEAHISTLPQPFSAPDPATEQRIIKQE